MFETIYKLQPHRTMHLRGFDRRGAAAAVWGARDDGFTLTGVFRDAADFCVLMLYDADDVFSHPRWRYLPDFDFSGLVLEFDVALTNLQPLDSPKFPSIDWDKLDVIRPDGSTAQVKLWDYAERRSGTFAVASLTYTLNGSPAAFDRVTLWYQNLAFDYIASGGETLENICTNLASQVNGANWPATGAPLALRATAAGASLTLSAARYGNVDTSGPAVSWVSGDKFTGLDAGNSIQIAGTIYTISAVNSPTTITLTASAGLHSAAAYLADRGGEDGNMVSVYELHKNSNLYFTPAGTSGMTGGDSAAVWHIKLDFPELGLSSVRQMWLTFAPMLANSSAYSAQEWSAAFSNWSVTGGDTKRALKVAGPGSVRVDSRDAWARYSGSGWQTEAGFFWFGFAKHTAQSGDSVTIEYHCQAEHDLYLGTSLYKDRAIVAVSLDGDAPTNLDCFLTAEPPVVSRRLLREAVAPGSHTVVITHTGTKHSSQGAWDIDSLGYHFYLDYLEASVASDVPDAPHVYADRSVATDFDTDNTYKLSPQRLVWMIDKSGLHGDLDHYAGVFWWNQRKRVDGSFPAVTVAFDGTWDPGSGLGDGDQVFLQLGGNSFNDGVGTVMGKTVFPADSSGTIAAHFASFINETFVGVWAAASGGTLTVTCRSPEYSFTFFASKVSAGGTLDVSGSLSGGTEGVWQIDDAVTPVINRAAADWHKDYFSEIAAKGWTAVAAFSMELVNPPDEPPSSIWAQRFRDNAPVLTATGFANLNSTQCAFSDVVAGYQKKAFKEMAGFMSEGGLTPWLQFGEFLWWFFTDYNAATNPAGGMSYYDAYTAAAAEATLARPLAQFQTPDDDPSLNDYGDTNFLRGQVKTHIDAIRTYVLSAYPDAKFELLWPYDVNNPVPSPIYNVGGRLNRYVNLPGEYEQKFGSGLDRLKMEALSFGATDRNLDKAQQTARFPYTAPMAWSRADVRYLIPWFNGGCPWVNEFLMASRELLPNLSFWAWDHLNLFGWRLPLPVEARRSVLRLR